MSTLEDKERKGKAYSSIEKLMEISSCVIANESWDVETGVYSSINLYSFRINVETSVSLNFWFPFRYNSKHVPLNRVRDAVCLILLVFVRVFDFFCKCRNKLKTALELLPIMSYFLQ